MSKLRTNNIENLDNTSSVDISDVEIKQESYVNLGAYETVSTPVNYNNSVVVDGVAYRLKTSTIAPYTLNGDWAVDAPNFTPVGDAVLRQDLADPAKGGYLVNVTTATGEQMLAEALDDRSTVAALEQLRADTLLEATLTVNIPSDYATLQEAVDDLSTLSVKRGGIIDLVIESGHELESGVSVSNGDYGVFRISSEDTEVSFSSSFTGKFISVTNARGPVLNCLVNAGGFGGDGYYCINGSSGIVNVGCGVKNAGGSGAVIQAGSSMRAVSTDFSGAAQHGYTVNTGSVLQASDSNADDSGWSGLACTKASKAVFENSSAKRCGQNAEPGDPQGGIKSSYGSEVNARGAVATDSFDFGVRSDNCSRAEVRDVDASGAINDGFQAFRGSVVFALNSKANNCGGIGYLANGGSSIVADLGEAIGSGRDGMRALYESSISAREAVVRNSGDNGVFSSELSRIHILSGESSGNTNNDLRVNRGSQIGAANCVTTSGSPAIGDTNLSSFNAIGGANGIIWTS